MTHEPWSRFILSLGMFHQLLGQIAGLLKFATHEVNAHYPIEHRKDPRGAFKFVTQLERTLKSLPSFISAKPFCRNEGAAERMLDLQLQFVARQGRGKAG